MSAKLSSLVLTVSLSLPSLTGAPAGSAQVPGPRGPRPRPTVAAHGLGLDVEALWRAFQVLMASAGSDGTQPHPRAGCEMDPDGHCVPKP